MSEPYYDPWDDYIADLFKKNGYQIIGEYIRKNATAQIEIINRLITNGTKLKKLEFFDMSIVSVVCGLELLIRHLLLKPLLGGMFLNEDWFDFIEEKKFFSDRAADEHDFLLKILLKYDLTIETVTLKDSRLLWCEFKKTINIRNQIVHKGFNATDEQVELAFLCMKSFIYDVLKPVYQGMKDPLGEDFVKDVTEGWSL